MIAVLIIAHGTLPESLVDCAIHVLGQRPQALGTLGFVGHADPDEREKALQAELARLDEGDGILVLTDLYGATPCNTLCRVLEPSRIEGISGVNLPMLLKALNYRETLSLPQLIERIVEGGRNSITHISETMCHAATGR